MAFSVATIVSRFSELIISAHHIDGVEFDGIDSVERCANTSLVFVDAAGQLPENPVAVVVTVDEVAGSLARDGRCVLVVENVRLAQALIKQSFQDYDHKDEEWEQIHASAHIHPSASVEPNVRIGPNVVIGKNVRIASGTHVRANAVIERDVVIGKDCVINAQVNIGYNCTLGDRVNVHSGVVIGNEGFGFAQDEQRNYHRIPHTGWVAIGNDVQIGANSNIDRGTYGPTTIGDGVKLDSLCHVAHNVHIDEGTLFASQACIAGSTYIGKRVMASGQVGILDHLKVADNTVLVHRTGVTESITEAGMYAGVPAKPFKEYVRALAVTRKVEKLSLAVKELTKKLS